MITPLVRLDRRQQRRHQPRIPVLRRAAATARPPDAAARQEIAEQQMTVGAEARDRQGELHPRLLERFCRVIVPEILTDVCTKARLRLMRGLKRLRSARILVAGHALVQDIRRGHNELATGATARHQLRTAFDQLAMAI